MIHYRRIRVIADGTSAFGRNVIRGVQRYVRDARRRWRIYIEMKPSVQVVSDWKDDEGSIFAFPNADLARRLLEMDHPTVNCLAHHESLGWPTVRADDEAVGRIAARHLLDRGLERILFWSGGDFSRAADLRWAGFQGVLAEAGAHPIRLPLDRSRQSGMPDPGSTARLIADLRTFRFPLGLFCGHDAIAHWALNDFVVAGIPVPEQVAVIGVDNDELQCEISSPPLTSIALPYDELGFEAARLLDALLHGRRPPSETLRLSPAGVIERASTDTTAVDDPRLAQALHFMRVHACDPCSVDQVVDEVRCSRRWLEVAMRRQLRRTPHDELRRIRMERAGRLLRMTSLPVRAVAEQCGYPLVQHFSKVFRDYYRQTPIAYRALVRREARPNPAPGEKTHGKAKPPLPAPLEKPRSKRPSRLSRRAERRRRSAQI